MLFIPLWVPVEGGCAGLRRQNWIQKQNETASRNALMFKQCPSSEPDRNHALPGPKQSTKALPAPPHRNILISIIVHLHFLRVINCTCIRDEYLIKVLKLTDIPSWGVGGGGECGLEPHCPFHFFNNYFDSLEFADPLFFFHQTVTRIFNTFLDPKWIMAVRIEQIGYLPN